MKVLPRCSRAAKLTGLIALTILAAAGLYLFVWGPFHQGEKKDKIFALVHVALPGHLIGEREDFSQVLQTQIMFLKSRPVLNAALHNPEVRQLKLVQQQVDPVAWLEGLVEVQVVDKEVAILLVTVHVDNPNDQVVLTNAVAVAYVNGAANKEMTLRLTRLEMLKKLHAEYDKHLREKLLHLRVLSGDLGVREAKNLAMKQEFALKQLSSLQGELLQVESRIRKAKAERESAQTMEKVPDAPVSPKDLVAKHWLSRLVALQKILSNEAKEQVDKVLSFNKKTEDLEWLKEEITQVDEMSRKVGQLTQELLVELQAPPRIALLEEAVASGR